MHVYEFNNPQNSYLLTLKATYTVATNGSVWVCPWLDFNGQTYVAIAIDDNASAPVLRVLRYDESAANTLTQVATFNYGATVYGLDWLVTGTNVYLAVGGSLDGQEVKILQFDPYGSTLSTVFTYNDQQKTAASGVKWNKLLSNPQYAYLAVGLDGSTGSPGARVLGFNINNQSQLCFVSDNTIADVANGTGLLADPVSNAAMGNRVYNCKEGLVEDVRTSYPGLPFDTSNWSVPKR